MKKFRLNVADLGATEILSREQLKSVFGGVSNSCTRSKGSETVSDIFTDWSAATLSGWVVLWQSLGWNASCSTMPILPKGPGCGSILV